MPKISVIVPVYNVEGYIERCIDSILAQTYQDFELILINDGSKDRSGEICDMYAKTDSRIHVFHKENGGQSSARNLALDWVFANSDSEWIHFVDSDDWIHPQMLEQLLCAASEYNVNISTCGYYEMNGELTSVDISAYSFQEFSPEDYYVLQNLNSVMPVAKLYRKHCFENIRYPVGKIHEDEFVSYKLLFAEKRIVVSDMPLYYYYQNPKGTTKSSWNPKRLYGIDAIQEQAVFFQNKGYSRAYEHAVLTLYGVAAYQLQLIWDSELTEDDKVHYAKFVIDIIKRVVWQYRGVYVKQGRWWYMLSFLAREQMRLWLKSMLQRKSE